jgi:Planctomycete cytochrome C
MRGFYYTTICSLVFSPNDSLNFEPTSPVDSKLIQSSVLGICMRCHAGSKNPNLSTLSNLKSHISTVLSEVDQNSMPPSDSGYAPLDDCRKSILRTWFEMGMPDSTERKVSDIASCKSGFPTNPMPPKPILEMDLNYETLVTQILQPDCLHCHNPKSNDVDAAEILLFPYSELMAGRIIGIDASRSKFYKMIVRTDEERMPPPEDGAPLSAEKIEFVRRWLEAGHPEK